MRLLLKWLLLCLLALALPLQGMAAAGAHACGPAAHAPSAAATPAGGDAPPQAHDPSHHSAPEHAHAAHASEDTAHVGPPQAEDHPTGHAQPSGGEHHKCSACATCCAGAALPTHLNLYTGTAAPAAFVPTQPHAEPGWLPPQPKRPPRPIAL